MTATSATATATAAAPRAGSAGGTRRRLDSLTIGLAIVGFFVSAALLAPVLTPYRAFELAGRPIEPPSVEFPLGTNGVGNDILTQVVLGARSSLLIALLAGLGTLVVGATVGLVSGWRGGALDVVLMRFTDIVLALPRLPLLILMGVYLGPTLVNTALVISLVFWPPSARIVRSQVLSIRGRAHLRASVGFGAGTWFSLKRHVVPEVGLILIASLIASAGRAVMLEAGLAFLGLGDPSRVSWGRILRDALDFQALFFTDAWSWWLVPPIVALSLFLLGLTLVGIGFEQRANPRLSRHSEETGR